MPKLTPLERELIAKQKQLDEELIEIAKQKDKKGELLARASQLLDEGAFVNAGGGKPLYFAARKQNYPLLYLLIDNGALSLPIAKNYIASICDYRGFDKSEEAFFALIDYAISITGFDKAYLIPYINCMFLHGRHQKTYRLTDVYGLKPREIVGEVYERVIFEIINNNHMETLEYIEGYRDWINRACFDTAISGGEAKVLAYMLFNGRYFEPAESSVCKAIYDGYTEILDLLRSNGFDLGKNPLYLKKACRTFYYNGEKALIYLLNCGFSLRDRYDGKTVYENAIADENTPLLEFLRKNGVNE